MDIETIEYHKNCAGSTKFAFNILNKNHKIYLVNA